MRNRPVVVAVAAAAVLLSGGCGGAASMSSSGATSGSPIDQVAVDGDLRKALAAAGLDHAQAMTTSERGGVKDPDRVNWYGTAKSADAEKALPKIGAALERAGWKQDGERTAADFLSYRKSDWRMVVSRIPGADLQSVSADSSMVQLLASRHGA
ncbi:hypothetical protein [Streptomyces sp. 2P-4]|uniref:hypothetical protein n=1 Tax=Streptomyces sp. 2P-4 TaxID=2931974 RepID=UPI00254049C4|nr:hypothetical protein [Streptomyces sp. 2P-4]